VQDRLDRGSVGCEFRFGEAEDHRDRDEAKLCAVVQVALDPPAFALSRLDETRARSLELGQPRPELGLEAGVFKRQRSGRAHRLHELAVFGQRGIVNERSDRLTLPFDERCGPARLRLRQLDGIPSGIDVAGGSGNPVCELERRITEYSAEGLAQVDRRLALAELDDEPRHRAACESLLQEHGENPNWNRCKDERPRPRRPGPEGVAEDVVGDGDREGGEHGTPGPEHGRAAPPFGEARAPPSADEERNRENGQQDAHRALGLKERVGEGVVARNLECITRAVGADLRARVGEQKPR
jgi:hypothetical protein